MATWYITQIIAQIEGRGSSTSPSFFFSHFMKSQIYRYDCTAKLKTTYVPSTSKLQTSHDTWQRGEVPELHPLSFHFLSDHNNSYKNKEDYTAKIKRCMCPAHYINHNCNNDTRLREEVSQNFTLKSFHILSKHKYINTDCIANEKQCMRPAHYMINFANKPWWYKTEGRGSSTSP